MISDLEQSDLAAALRAVLGLQAPAPGRDPSAVVRRLLPDPRAVAAVRAEVARRFGDLLATAARSRLGEPVGGDPALLHSLWEVFARWALGGQRAWEQTVYDLVVDGVSDGLRPRTTPAPPAGGPPTPPAATFPPIPINPPPVQARPAPPKNLADNLYQGPPPLPPAAKKPPPPKNLADNLYQGPPPAKAPPGLEAKLHPDAGKTNPMPDARNALTPNPDGPPPKAEEYAAAAADPAPAEPPAPTAPGWRYLPVPDDPDRHDEFDARELPDPPAGFRLIGARVRGKKHKHDGTNCDDWFEFGRAGAWTVLAASDGAGSKKLSRVGARAACGKAVEVLAAGLRDVVLDPDRPKDEWEAALARADDTLAFADPRVDAVRRLLHDAVNRAYAAVVAAHAERAGKPEYEALVNNRPLEVGDLSCTLLLAVHRPIRVGDAAADVVLAVQVGDGLVGAVSRSGAVKPLGAADSGGFSGETEFLTSEGKRDPDYLDRKVDAFLGSLQALLVMTDGVADDYFPADQELGRLWADLVVNDIPDVAGPSADEVNAAVGKTPLMSADKVPEADFGEAVEVVSADAPRPKVVIRSAAALAEKYGVPVAHLLQTPALLAAARGGPDPLPGDAPADRLRAWLDAYQVRGSFDDRTLVVLHREGLS
ncbi:MAG: protein phosphatase 2C domain-containing protein [Gemmataceae bacterium]|nr:protein phosphatase 2C domain-containing protein [Gemmataceae bacterium]